MTQEEKAVAYINNPSGWILWPVVPVVHKTKLDGFGMGLCGLLFEEDRKDGWKVYHANLMDLPMSSEQFRALEVSKYETLEDLIKDWRVD